MRARGKLLTSLLAASLACVAYDTAGSEVPAIDGTYMTTIAVSYANYIELRSDTLLASMTLRDLNYRGTFDGRYGTAFGDSGRVGGVERPERTLVVTEFGAPPPAPALAPLKPIAYVMGLRQLYPWCDFPRLGTGPLSGLLNGDSLLLNGRGSLPCFYHLNGTPVEIGTELHVRIVGVR
jgi:hypothetical protein